MLQPGLYVVSTPIGNLRDITLRALDVLAAADEVLAEDTRVAGKLLSAYGVKARLSPYHDHNGAERRPELLRKLSEGARIALVSDAGTPLVSDPGWKLAHEALEAGHRVFPIPGASAMLAGLVASGLPSDRFCFAGFLPPKQGARTQSLESLKAVPATLIFYESGPRLADTLADMASVLGAGRQGAVARELTKLFEETRRGTLADLAAHYAEAAAPIYSAFDIDLAEGESCHPALRPEKVSITAERPADRRNAVQGTIIDIAYLGNLSTYHVKLPTGQMIKAQTANTRRLSRRDFTWEDRVWLSWSDTAAVLLRE